jgi:Domain of unknown function (DUF1905)
VASAASLPVCHDRVCTVKTYKFNAKIEAGIGGGAGVMFPYNVEQEFGTKARVPVRSTIDGVPYTGSLVNCGDDCHLLGVLKSIREQIGKGPGDSVEVVLWRDAAERVVEVPPAFAERLRREDLLPFFEKLS